MMNSRWLRLAGIGTLVFLLALVFNLPAGWGLTLLQERLPVEMQWRDASGSIFDASIDDLLVILPDGRRAALETLAVQTDFLPLLLGRLQAGFRGRGYGGEFSGRGRVSAGSWRLEHLQGAVSLAELAPLAPELDLAAVTGRLLFRATDLSGSFGGLPDSGQVAASLAELRLGLLDSGGPLGDYNLELQAGAAGPGIRGTVTTVSDDARLHIHGQMQLDDSRLQFTGQGWAGNTATASIHGLLPLLGQVNDGRASINWRIAL